MVTSNANKFNLLMAEEVADVTSTPTKTKEIEVPVKTFDVISTFEDDPFVGHLSTPITTSSITKTYLSLLPAYKPGLSPLLRGINIGYVHGYFLLGPFVQLGPLRDSQVANFVGFVSTISLIIILTTCLLIYGFVTFKNNDDSDDSATLNWLTSKGWSQFTSGFIVGGFGGASIAYVLLKLVNFAA
jgi:photosystem I subunit 11|tara:strand:+ start:44 stop:601 length:558 start_codon:yes stop_codon:yes gene_type:complete